MAETFATWLAKAAMNVAINAGANATIQAIAYNATYYAVQAAIIIAPGMISRALQDAPEIGSTQGSLKQPIPPRIRGYGRMMVPVHLVCWEAKENFAYDSGAWHHGRAKALHEVWSHDHKLNLTPGGHAEYSPEYGLGHEMMHVEWRLGLPTETAYSALVAALGPVGRWSSNHRGDGLATIGVDYRHGKKENLPTDYPHGEPRFRVVGELSPIWDPRQPGQTRGDDSNWNALENPVLQIMDLLTHPEGFDEDYDTTIAPVLDHWIAQANICDEPVGLKAGGTIPRYTSRIYYALSGDPQEPLNALLQACDGRLITDADGCYRLWVGKLQEPTVHLTDEDIDDYQVNGDPSVEDVVNELLPRYLSEEHKWQMVETEAWRLSADVVERGRVETAAIDLLAVGNNSQARRLMKREASRQLAELRGVLFGKLSCERAVGQRWVRATFAELGMVGEIIELEEGGSTSFRTGVVSLPFTTCDVAADSWSPATEEGDGPRKEDSVTPEALAAPTISDVVVINEGVAARLRVTMAGPTRNDLTGAFRWRVVGDVSWVEGTFPDLEPGPNIIIETGLLPAGASVEVQGGYLTGGGQMSPWSTMQVVSTVVSPNAADVAVLAYLDALNVQPGPSQTERIRTLIKALMDGDVWSYADRIMVRAAHDPQAALVNLRNPVQVDTAVNAPAFLAYRGYIGDGSTSYIETGFDLSTGGKLYGQDDASMYVWNLTEGQNNSPVLGTERSRIVVRTTGDLINVRGNAAAGNTTAETSAIGLTGWSRLNSTAFSLYKNGSLRSSPARASEAPIPGQTVRELGSDNTGGDNYAAQRIAFSFIGRGLNNTRNTNLYTAVQAYLASVGAV